MPCASRHLPCVVYTRSWRSLFTRQWWVHCWKCEARMGPFNSWQAARLAAQGLTER